MAEWAGGVGVGALKGGKGGVRKHPSLGVTVSVHQSDTLRINNKG